MKALVLAGLLLAGAPDGEVCDACTPRRLCKPHDAEIDAALKEVKRDLKDDDPAVRRAALDRVGALNASHVNAPSKDVTKVIVAVLEDEELAIRTEAVRLLGSGQDPETAVRALVDFSDEVPRMLGRVKATDPDAKPAMEFAVTVVRSVASYRDDRTVEALGNILTRSATSVYGDAVYRIVDGLTDLAAREGIEALLAYQALIEGLEFFPSLEKHVHDRLAAMAARLELGEAPAWSEDGVSEAWEAWFDENERALPKKLGKATLEPGD